MKFATAIVCSLAAAPALALQQPIVSPRDTRVLYADYDPGNPIPLQTTVGGNIIVNFGGDWTVYEVGGADSTRMFSDDKRPHDQFVIWQARGCIPPAMFYALFFNNTTKERRLQTFEIHTWPMACDTDLTPQVRKATPEVRAASYLTTPANAAELDSFNPRQMWGRGLAWLPSDDALTEHPKPNQIQQGKPTTWTLNIRYPQDERDKKAAKAAASREERNARAVEEGLEGGAGGAGAPYDPSCKTHFLYQGDPGLEPDAYSSCQNGFSTFFGYKDRRKPILSFLAPDHKETMIDNPLMRGEKIGTMRVAHVWFVRDGDSVGKIIDCNSGGGCAYQPVASDPGTGTDNPRYRRVIRKHKVAANGK